jgi:methanogenic corrinoid protein MtbC1
MKVFTIAQLEQFSGIKAHTIRIWEQRYNALQPSRSEGNTRYYDNNQLRRLLNISSLMEYKYKPSKLCILSDEALGELVQEHLLSKQDENPVNEFYITQLIAAATAYNEQSFSTIFNAATAEKGLKLTYGDIIYPLLVRVGYMWTQDSMLVTQEHFMSSLIKQKVFTAVEQIENTIITSDRTWLLFLPENEFHELGLLIANYILKSTGNKVYYLGSNVPLHALNTTLEDLYVSDALTFLVHTPSAEDISEYAKMMEDHNVSLHIATNEQTKKYLSDKLTCTWLTNLNELEQHG